MADPRDIHPHIYYLGDVKPWHVVTAHCGQCNHAAPVSHEALLRGRKLEDRIYPLRWPLRCTKCGTRDGKLNALSWSNDRTKMTPG